ncbi:hypothetical protein [Caproiciproducens faecalis]|uniref:Uncharacterized protein n=1 Tax=Caproiciproducens faecalis TaxID=2820301 RepID=A0ABS7DRG2_9FIRM|nr:hypothetical protein [Caproiciproducens faecalis]MBW7573885.1 hypothetical protein [Caproiciproducens faecalis]
MRHFYAALFIIGLIGLYISAGAAEIQPLLPCAISGIICTVAAGIGIRGFNWTERRDKPCMTRAKSAKADFLPKYAGNSATRTNGRKNVM